MEIKQGDIFWFDPGEPIGSSPGFLRPVVVIQNNAFNRTTVNTVLVCFLTTNLRRAKSPGNVLLDENEADLPKQSVVVVSQMATVDKLQLNDKIGALSIKRLVQIIEGINYVIEPREL